MLVLAALSCRSEARVVITNRDQRAGAVDREVTIIATQTRTKSRAEVDGDYARSDRKVIVRGVLRELVYE